MDKHVEYISGVNDVRIGLISAENSELIREFIEAMSGSFEVVDDESEYRPERLMEHKPYNHKIDFSRTIIKSQVVCRKPRYAVKKIIR